MSYRVISHPILEFPQGKKAKFTFNGETVEGVEGEPIAAALIAQGYKVMSYSKKMHRPRGLFCARGHCASCLMEVDGIPNVRVCTETVREGIVVRTMPGK